MQITDKRKQATKNNYAQISTLYRDDFEKDFAHFDFIDTAIDELKKNHINDLPFVDLGCGPGNVTDYLLANGITNIIAVDITPEFCEMVGKKHSDIEVHCSDMTEYMKHVTPSSVAACIASFSIIHIPDEEIDELFVHIHKALVTHGYFVMSCHKGTYKGMEVDPYITQKDQRLTATEKLETYMNYFTEEELKERIIRAGFQIIKMETFSQEFVAGDIDVPKIWTLAKKT